jgi:hypothetical protein
MAEDMWGVVWVKTRPGDVSVYLFSEQGTAPTWRRTSNIRSLGNYFVASLHRGNFITIKPDIIIDQKTLA